MDLEEKYKEETGELATRRVNIHESIVRSYTNEYVKWLESKALIIDIVVGQSEQLPKNNCTLNRETCGKGSGCKYPHCHL